MRALVTGASGYIGGHLVKRLSEDEVETRAFVRNTSNITKLKELENVEICYGDLTDFSSLEKAVRGIQVVYHIGGLASDWGDYRDFYRVNYLGTKNTLQASVDSHIEKFIYLSTMGVQDLKGSSVIQEDQPYGRFTGNYLRSKAKAEQYVRRYSHLLPTVIIRPPAVYGPGDPLCTTRALRFAQRNLMLLISRGRGIFPHVYIDNLVDALCLANQNESAVGEIFNLTDGEDTSTGEFFTNLNHIAGKGNIRLMFPYPIAWGVALLMDIFARLTGKHPLLSRVAFKFLTLKCRFDISKARNKLGYNPAVSLNEGMRRIKLWWDSKYYSQ
ncbi:MAG: NAD-dependent epimerase/dehydratase family protein [Candidatus Aminicenantes bacterium]|nr:MAG: NAD-dependent epimerase/dehydratase family protein [Candidatus Aminicenantes bacterium]